METVIEFLGFSLGAGLTIRAVNALGGGLRPAMRGIMRAGLTAGEAIGGMASKTADAVSDANADGRAGSRREESISRAEGVDTTPRQIVIARE